MTDLTSTHRPLASSKLRGWLPLLLIVVAAAFLRFHILGVRSLNPAECFSVLVAREAWPKFLRIIWWGEGNMAFYYTLLRGWLRLGDSEVWLQSLSALFAVMTIPAVYALGNRFLSRKVGLIGAALLAIHNFHIEYSEMVRSYSLLALLVVLSTYTFLALLDSPDRKGLWMLYVLFSTLAFYAQTFTVLILCGQWLGLGPRRIKRLGVLKLLSAGAAIVILAAPLLAVMILENKGQLDWVPPLSFAGTMNVLWGIVGANILALHSSVASMLLLTLYVIGWIFAVWGIFRNERLGIGKPTAVTVWVLVWSLAFPLVAMAAISFLKPILYPRYLLMCVPAAVLLAGQGLTTIERCVARGQLISSAVLVLMIALSLVGISKFETTLPRSGLDYRGVTNYILSHREAGDAVIFYNFGGNCTWEYYVGRARKAGDNAPTPPTLFPLSFDRASIERRTAPYRRVWVVLQHDIPTPQSDANTALLVKTMLDNFRLAEEREFPGESMYPGEYVSIRLFLYDAPAP
jgi:4-amino-4-deoxy-L-arabinose transferase-like glycosyltransferase